MLHLFVNRVDSLLPIATLHVDAFGRDVVLFESAFIEIADGFETEGFLGEQGKGLIVRDAFPKLIPGELHGRCPDNVASGRGECVIVIR